jgi:cyclic pyranopterin phosphate synthase
VARPSVEGAVYSFEALLPHLDSPPIAARRALEHAGLRLSVEGWRSLATEERERLTLAGTAEHVDTAEVVSIVRRASPAAADVVRGSDPDATTPPEGVVRALAASRPLDALDAGRWARLRAIDRYALALAHRGAVARSASSSFAEAAEAILGPTEPDLSSHLTQAGEVHMVDVARKPQTARRAVASGSILMRRETLERLVSREAPKGVVLATARLAAIMAAKRTHELVPLCHLVALTHVEVALEPRSAGTRGAVDVTATVDAFDRTGCEMEAMVAVTTACLTVYDMLKGIDRDMVLTDVKLLEKSGGRSGHYVRSRGGDP